MRHHLIYFLQRQDGLIKIGTTSDLPQRIEALTSHHGPLLALRVINGDASREQAIHHQFRHLREFGEWFRDDGSLKPAMYALPEGSKIDVTESQAEIEWMKGEAELMEAVGARVEGLIKYRGDRLLISRDEALRQVNADYGFSKHFLDHIRRGKARTVSAYGHQRIREAYLEEMRLLADQLRQEAATEGHALEAEARALVAKIQARKARKVA